MEPTFEHYTTSQRGSRFRVGGSGDLAQPDLREDQRPFDRAIYSQEVHSPVPVLATGHHLAKAYHRCLDLPIRLRGQEDYALPEEWAELLPLVRSIAEVEHSNNPSVVEDYHTYLTVDSSWQEEGGQQRNGGLHVDGFQGARIRRKTKVTRNYVASSNGGTRFYPQTFDASLDDAVYNLFEGFTQQAKTPIVAMENTVWFMDAYTVHESGFAARPGWRTFLRMTYDCKEFDRLGNSINGMLDYSWTYVRRDAHARLLTPPTA